MKLYYSPGACSLSPHIVLQELGLKYTPVLASTKSHKLQDGTDYYSINPLGYVPMLELDDGRRLHEGPADRSRRLLVRHMQRTIRAMMGVGAIRVVFGLAEPGQAFVPGPSGAA